MKLHPYLFAVLLAAPTFGGEHKVERKAFAATADLEGTFLPDQVQTFQIDPKVWTDFTVLDYVAQGQAVKKGDVIVSFDTEAIDRKLADNRDARTLRKLNLASAERQLADLEKTTPRTLDTAKLGLQRAEADLDYYKKIGRPMAEESARRSLESAERSLEYATEELEQLLKMYREDEITEETEEIILKRQRTAVDNAQYRLRTVQENTKRALEVQIPRSAFDTEDQLIAQRLNWETLQESLPRALTIKRLEVKALQIADQRADQAESDLESDRSQMSPTAPGSGLLYLGEIADGKWKASDAAKFMKRGGKVAPRVTYASFIPDGAKLQLDAFVGENQIAQLKRDQVGYVAPAAAPRSRIPVKVHSVAGFPGIDGKYHVVLQLTGEPEGLALVPGMKGKIKLRIQDAKDALVIPVKALHEEADGSYSVEVKDGDVIRKRTITVGVESGGSIEVLSGLEAGETIVIPDTATPPKK